MKMSTKNRLKKLEERNKLMLKKNNLDKKSQETEKNSVLDCTLGTLSEGEPISFSLKKIPHLIVDGEVGSGKFFLVNLIVTGMMANASSEELKFVIIDPKKAEFASYKDSPYMLINPIGNLSDVYETLTYLVKIIDERYRLFSESEVGHIVEYNKLSEKNEVEKLPFLVLIIDNLADFIKQHKEVEQQIIRIVQIGRYAGVHAIININNPRTTELTGLIQSNIPDRISLWGTDK